MKETLININARRRTVGVPANFCILNYIRKRSDIYTFFQMILPERMCTIATGVIDIFRKEVAWIPTFTRQNINDRCLPKFAKYYPVMTQLPIVK